MRWMSLLVLLTLTVVRATAQPVVAAVANAASNRLNGLPSSQLAQGSIGVAYGRNMGPANIVIASTPPWPTTLSGTSAQFEAGGQTINLPIYYTSATQIAFLVPSNTPAGGGAIRVTYNGQTSATFAIGTVQSNLGIFTVNSQGSGPAIVTYADYSLVSRTKAANPGQTLILWATGLGPVTGNETTTPLPGDMTNVPLRLWIGGVSANIIYRGRSGCCIAEDQIVFVVPDGVSGCNVPIVAQINTAISNYATMAIAPSGSTCAPYNPSVPASIMSQIAATASPTFGFVELSRDVADRADRGESAFFKLNGSGRLLADAIDTMPLGACTVIPFFNAPGPTGSDPFDTLPISVLDAGASLAISSSGRNRTLPKTPPGSYEARLGDTSAGNYFDPGVYTITGTGGRDVGSFTTSITVPQPLVWTNPPVNNTPVVRANGLTVNWTGGDPNGFVNIEGEGSILTAPGSNTVFAGAQFQCLAPASAGTFVIPPAVLLTLPPQPANPAPGSRPVFGFIALSGDTAAATFTAPGTDGVSAAYEYRAAGVPIVFQ
jgi:uncharacterized protein (TIGR03437 family)